MNTKEKVIRHFEENKGTYWSGEAMAESLGVSRNAVWKAVRALREEGYDIGAIPNRGYCLSMDTDILSSPGIDKYIDSSFQLDCDVISSTSSTNDLLRERAVEGAPEGTVILANEQTKGKGRRGRSFYSPAHSGVYMSILLRPEQMVPEDAIQITTMAAVATAEAIEEVSGKEVHIKWVNDLFMDGKKVTGILTEASFNLETALLDYVVLGIGINAYPPEEGFPEELEAIAGSVFSSHKKDGKNFLAASVLRHFFKIYHGGDRSYVERYRQRSMVLGQDILVHKPSGVYEAKALDLDEQCHLLVEYADHSTETLSSGEISIRLKEQRSL